MIIETRGSIHGKPCNPDGPWERPKPVPKPKPQDHLPEDLFKI